MGRRTSTTTTDPAGNVATDTYLYDGWDLLNTASSTGDTASITSAGTPLIPLGKAVADNPSARGRAPMPPAEKKI